MNDRFRGIDRIGPSYPVKPVDPSAKDRPSGERQRKPEKRPPTKDGQDENDRPPEKPRRGTIDEYI